MFQEVGFCSYLKMGFPASVYILQNSIDEIEI